MVDTDKMIPYRNNLSEQIYSIILSYEQIIHCLQQQGIPLVYIILMKNM